MQGFAVTDLPNGPRYMVIAFVADEDKRGTWAQDFKGRTGIGERDWMREMELYDDIHEGEPVYADYSPSWHGCLGNDPIPIIKGSSYVGGWDCSSSTLSPAFVLVQVTPPPQLQVHAILEVVPGGPESMDAFCRRVMKALMKRLPTSWDTVEHFGDAMITQRSGVNFKTSQQVAQEHGIRIRPASNDLDFRIGCVTKLLVDRIDESIPRFVVDQVNCPILSEGFKGAYKIDVMSVGDPVGPGRVLRERPLKNEFSHTHDSLQYCAQHVVKVLNQYRPWAPYGRGAKEFGNQLAAAIESHPGLTRRQERAVDAQIPENSGRSKVEIGGAVSFERMRIRT